MADVTAHVLVNKISYISPTILPKMVLKFLRKNELDTAL